MPREPYQSWKNIQIYGKILSMAIIHSPRNKKRKFFGFFVLALLLAILAAGVITYNLIINLPNPQIIIDRSVIESTKIFDRTGKVLLYEIHGEEKRTVTPIQEIPTQIKNATLAAEDINFYKHIGLDWRGILRALLVNLTRGNISQGGSTITQQLIKNSILTGERTFTRKIKEALLALVLERKYSKDEILEWYLNQIPYGSNAYGINAAAQTYFAKPLNELTLSEMALLGALPKAPTYYSPYGSRKDELLKRRDWVLERMAEAGFIKQEEAEQAKKEKLNFAPPRASIRAPHFVMYIKEYLIDKYGENFVEQGGLNVFTTLDWNLQEEAEKIVKEGAEKNEKLVQAANASLVALNPKNGEILAMVGSKDYWSPPLPKNCRPGLDCRFDPHVNVTTRARQPGSAFKPFVYATAFKKGYTPETVLFDTPTEFNPNCNPDGTPGPLIKDPKDCYHPQNYDGKFRGPVNLRQALAQSLNLPSVKLLYLAGMQNTIKTAQTLGITTLNQPDRYGLSLVLGGAEVNLLEMASSFGAFAQEGILHSKTGILRIENSKGVVLEEKKDSSLPALDTEIARTINNILSDNNARVPIFNPRSSLFFPDREVAAKTGTTQDFRDAWVIGYSPSLVAGVWVGNNNNAPMNQAALSIMVAGPIWHRFLEFALKNTPPEEFNKPSAPTVEKPILRGLYRIGQILKIDKISKKLATPDTPPELTEEVSFGEIKTILATLKKEDPLADPPTNPEEDPQFKNWQAGIDAWLASNPLPGVKPPQETDDLHTPAKKPKISIINIISSAEDVEVKLKIKSVFPLQEVLFFLDDELLGSKTSPIIGEDLIFSLKTREKIIAGVHKIKTTAYDAVGNQETAEQEWKVSE